LQGFAIHKPLAHVNQGGNFVFVEKKQNLSIAKPKIIKTINYQNEVQTFHFLDGGLELTLARLGPVAQVEPLPQVL